MNTLLNSASAVTSWMVFSLMIGGVVIVAALAAHDAQRAANRSVRWVWMAAIGMIVGLSLAAPLRREPALSRTALELSAPAGATVSYPKVPERSLVMDALLRAREATLTPLTHALERVERFWLELPAPFHRFVMIAWALTAVITLGLLCVSYWRVRRRVKHWPTQDVAGVSARIAPTAGPAVVGLAPSEIVLPAWLLGRPVSEQRLVVAHETEHVRAGDPWLLVVASAAVAAMPWHPALWFAFGRLRLAVELDCDRRVIDRGVTRSDYGSLLIDLSALRRTLPSAMPAFSCNGSYLERRLVAMTTGRTRFATARRIGGGLFAAAMVVTACSSELPTSAEVEKMDVAAAERKATTLAMLDTSKRVYLLDGHIVAKDSVLALKASDIASVEIAKRRGQELDEVRVTRLRNKMYAVKRDDSAQRIVADSVIIRDGVPLQEFRVRMKDTSRVAEVMVKSPEAKTIFDGLLVIDEKISDPTLLERIDRNSIERIEVIKGAAAQLQYSDPRASRGVIKVTLKKP